MDVQSAQRLLRHLILLMSVSVLTARCGGANTPPTISQVARGVEPHVEVIPSGDPLERRILSIENLTVLNAPLL